MYNAYQMPANYALDTHAQIHTALSGDLRLVRNGLSSPSYSSGRLEVYYGGSWKSVCYDGWTTANTRVACRQLGFDGAAGSTTNSIAR